MKSQHYFRFNVFILTLLLLFSSTSSSAQDLKCFTLKPPDEILAGVQRIAIAEFTVTSSFKENEKPGEKKKNVLEQIVGAVEKAEEVKQNQQRFADTGRKLSDLMIAALIKKDRGIEEVSTGFLGLGREEGRTFQNGAFTNVFSVVERGQIDQVISEMQLGQSGIVDQSTAAQVGQMLGVDAIVTGSINVSYQNKWTREEKGSKDNKRKVDCEKRTAVVNASIRIIKVETAEVIGSNSSRKKEEGKKCEGDWGQLATPEAMVDKPLEEIAREMVDYFAPSFEYNKFKFDEIKNKKFKRQAEVAKKSLDEYDLDTAYLQYASIAEQDAYSPAVNYNLGVLHEAVGNFKKAQEKYNIAYSLKSREGRYRDAKKRIARQVEYWDQLSALGIELEGYEFSTSKADMAMAAMARLEVKGSSSDRIDIKAAPDPASETLVKVPGEIEMQLVGKARGWYKVKLLDGREGYIHQDNAKVIN